ncbi:MAG TPA: chromate resistance protein ChrB domain-containing protein [Thermoanaerobaculia bacterium]|nr:chromate resistance protein ChrB domain-containing protein [Thermoanaerobaculia bacterium]
MSRPRWCLLIHQLPPKPLYLRARIRQRLARVGAVALKNSVYVLPQSNRSVEDFQSIAEEAVDGGGEAFVGAVDFLGRPSDEEIEERFRRERAADYGELSALARELLRQARRGGIGASAEGDLSSRASRLQKRLGEAIALDFFAAPERAVAEAALRQLETQVQAAGGPTQAPAGAGRQRFAKLAGLTWVTRKGVHVDRIASAWLIRRFIDPAARFRFADSQSPEAGHGEMRFDTVGGEFTHEGDRCSFETLVARLGLRDPAVSQIAEIVHDIDLKDGKFGRADAPGILQLVNGLALSHPEDVDRLDRGFALFDDLYESFRRRLPARTSSTARRSP